MGGRGTLCLSRSLGGGLHGHAIVQVAPALKPGLRVGFLLLPKSSSCRQCIPSPPTNLSYGHFIDLSIDLCFFLSQNPPILDRQSGFIWENEREEISSTVVQDLCNLSFLALLTLNDVAPYSRPLELWLQKA
jgi:hypothetical protein